MVKGFSERSTCCRLLLNKTDVFPSRKLENFICRHIQKYLLKVNASHET